MNQIGIMTNCDKPDAPQVMLRVANVAKRLGLTLVTCDQSSELLPDSVCVAPGEFGKTIDCLVAFGGDGTLLSSVRNLGDSDVPVMGVNLGSLGFMTSVPEDDVERAFEVLANDTYVASARTRAFMQLRRNGAVLAENRALNDVVIGWGTSTRVVTLAVEIDGKEVTSYVCDGLIVSTPTGSTGHQLSAGGPIVHPETPAFVINVICPHALSARPLVVPDSATITVHISDTAKELILSVDGQATEGVHQGDSIDVSRHEPSLTLLQLPEYRYFTVLRQKLGWRGSIIK